jgi:hypothetical protein
VIPLVAWLVPLFEVRIYNKKNEESKALRKPRSLQMIFTEASSITASAAFSSLSVSSQVGLEIGILHNISVLNLKLIFP